MNTESVDLIATDPPFKKGRDFHSTPSSLNGQGGGKFQDRWSWERDVHESWLDQIKDDKPAVWEVIDAANAVYMRQTKANLKLPRDQVGSDMGAFLCFMAVRLMAMHRVLKPTGSIYLHCDPTASHYLKAVMDAVFGWKNFRNEIVWGYKTGGASKKSGTFAKKHDAILYYSKNSKENIFNTQLEHSYNLTLPEPHTRSGKSLGVMRDSLGKYRKTIMRDWWVEYGLNKDCDITPLYRNNNERLDYPTQKPLSLYTRIIKASSNENDVVLDPFAGCATTCVAAERLGRQWVGIDLWDKAHETVINRLEREVGFFGDVHYTKEVPERTDEGETAASILPTINKRDLEPWQKLSRQQITDHLAGAQSFTEGLVTCAGCGRELERPFMELDHIRPRSDEGVNDISNRILLCRPCNGRKSDSLTMKGLIRENKKIGWMQDETKAQRARDAAKRCHMRLVNHD